MEAIKTRGVVHKGVLSVEVPDEFNEKEVEVIVLSQIVDNETAKSDETIAEHEGKVKRLMSIVGAAKFPDIPISKYDVYEQ